MCNPVILVIKAFMADGAGKYKNYLMINRTSNYRKNFVEISITVNQFQASDSL
jgi:hypothetical protein